MCDFNTKGREDFPAGESGDSQYGAYLLEEIERRLGYTPENSWVHPDSGDWSVGWIANNGRQYDYTCVTSIPTD